MGKIQGLRAGGLRKENVIFYCRPAKKDSITYFGTIARDVISATGWLYGCSFYISFFK